MVHAAETSDTSVPSARQHSARFHNIDILQSPPWESQISHRKLWCKPSQRYSRSVSLRHTYTAN